MNSDTAYTLATVPAPATYPKVPTPVLSDETMKARLNNVLSAMQQQGLSSLVIYADKEHGGNFEYLSGFIPRFEEALLVVSSDGKLTYIWVTRISNWCRMPNEEFVCTRRCFPCPISR